MPYIYTRRVNYHETDQMGVVHHSNYLRYFEEARTDFMRTVGLPYAVMEARGILMPVLEVACRYKSPARYDDELTIRSRMNELDAVRCGVAYTVHNQEGQLLAEAASKHCFIDKGFRPLSLKRSAPDLYEVFAGFYEPDAP